MSDERERRCIQIATLDPEAYPQNEMHRRVYSILGISPTVQTCNGGGKQPLIIVEDGE